MAALSDDQLWRESSGGDRDAFGIIVERYQSLICSLAYSACGNLARSEDLAQETFVIAWQRLAELREPARLRAWLCGIVRNLASGSVRREIRRGAHQSIETLDEPQAAEADPAAQTVSQEEADLLWRSLAGLPETYREPMILFYRQGQSIAEVAQSLELSEDAVKQRLSRGRALLRSELAALVETTLARTTPGAAFKAAVMIALPLASASTTSAAAAASLLTPPASAAAKGILAKIGLGAFIGPAIGLTCAWLGTRAAAAQARSPREGAVLKRSMRGIIAFCIVMSLALAAVLVQAGKAYTASASMIVTGVFAWTGALLLGIMLEWRRMDREIRRIRVATGTTDDEFLCAMEAAGKKLRLPKYFESRARFLGLPLLAVSWGASEIDRIKPRKACAWIAWGDVAISPFIAMGGLAIAPISFGAISIGIFALSIFWGVGIGVVALGSLACGWWSIGCAAVGWKLALGFASVARENAVAFAAAGAKASTEEAKNYVLHIFAADLLDLFARQAHGWLFVVLASAVALRRWRDRETRLLSKPPAQL